MLATKARMRPIRLVIADRRPIVLQGFATLFAAERDFAIVASCLDGASCLKAIRTLTPDLVLVEDGFSDVTASDMLAVVTAENIPARLVFYTASVAHGDLAAAIAAGSCCAISMREEPEALMQSLRWVAPPGGQAAAGQEQNGASAETGLLPLSDQERRIMRLVAYGMSNKQIARQLNVSTGTIKARLDRISEQLEIKGRTEIAAFALSRLFGGIGALAALLYAALDDIRPADAAALGHDPADTFTVKTTDGSGETVTIKINAKNSLPAPVKTAKSLFKLGRVDNPAAETPGRASRPVQSSIDIGAGTITPPATSSASPALSAFMTTAVAIWLCEQLGSVAQASNLGDSFTVLAPATEKGTGEWAAAALHSPGNADAALESFAWFHPEAYHQAFAFRPPGSDTIAGNDGAPQPVGADVDGVSVSSDGKAHVGSGSIEAVIDHGGVGQAAAADTSANSGTDGLQGTAQHETNPGQSQAGLHGAGDDVASARQHGNPASAENGSPHGQQQRDEKDAKDGSVAAPPHSKHDAPDDKPNHGQSKHDSQGSKAGPAAAEQHARDDAKPAHGASSEHAQHDAPDDKPNHGQSKHDSQGSEGGPAAAEQHARDDAKPPHGANSDHAHRAHEASSNPPGNLQAGPSPHPEAKHEATNGSGQAHMPDTPGHGDSFHFKNEMAASQASRASEVHGGHGPDPIKYDLHIAGSHELQPLQIADLIVPSAAEQSAAHQAHDPGHHQMHDLFA